MTPPAISIARFEITSLAFMFVCVPLPVCHTRKGKCASSFPSITSAHACTINFSLSLVSLPRSLLTMAQAFLRMPRARIISRGITSKPMLK